MSDLRNQKTYAFIVGYLMGVEEKVLYRDYSQDYAMSEGSVKFNEVPNAVLLRALSRVKQSMLRNHLLYTSAESLSSVSAGYLDAEMAILAKNDINLEEVFYTAGELPQVLNETQRKINEILPEVLMYLNVPYIKQLSMLFHLSELDNKSLTKLMNTIKDNWSTLPHGMIVVKKTRIDTQLPYILQNDRNLFGGSHALAGAIRFNEEKSVVPAFEWETLGQPPEVVISVVEDASSSCGEVTVVKGGLTEDENPVDGQWATISNGATLYVDCDNMHLFSLLSMLEALDGVTKAGVSHRVKLFIDSKSSYLWRMVDKLSKGKYTFDIIEVNRIKDAKSVVDMAMSTHITRDVYQHGIKCVGILSSDSDFFGLLENIDGVDFFVGYNNSDTNPDYADYLKRRGFGAFNLEIIGDGAKAHEHKLTIITHLCLSRMAELPMSRWNANDVSEWVCYQVGKDVRYNLTFQKAHIQEIVSSVFENLNIEMSGSTVLIRSLEAQVEVSLGVA